MQCMPAITTSQLYNMRSTSTLSQFSSFPPLITMPKPIILLGLALFLAIAFQISFAQATGTVYKYQ